MEWIEAHGHQHRPPRNHFLYRLVFLGNAVGRAQCPADPAPFLGTGIRLYSGCVWA